MPKHRLAFWLTRDKEDGFEPENIVRWDGPAKPVYENLHPLGDNTWGWSRGPDVDAGDKMLAKDAAASFCVPILPSYGEAIPYYITPGNAIRAN